MNKAVRNIIAILIGVIIFGVIAVSVLAGKASRAPLKCTGIDVVITDSLDNDFVSEEDVKKFLDKEYGQYIGQPLDSLDLCRIEKIIDGRSAVLKSEAYVTKNGILNISVTQRKPVVRFQKQGGGFYADIEGFVFPLQSSYASYVHIVDGDIPINMKSGHKGEIENPEEKQWFDGMMNVIRFLEGNATWKDRVVQIHIENGGEMVLIPREGKERFIFGQPVNIRDKFERMERYYTGIAPQGREYSSVNLKYDGQIVCR